MAETHWLAGWLVALAVLSTAAGGASWMIRCAMLGGLLCSGGMLTCSLSHAFFLPLKGHECAPYHPLQYMPPILRLPAPCTLPPLPVSAAAASYLSRATTACSLVDRMQLVDRAAVLGGG